MKKVEETSRNIHKLVYLYTSKANHPKKGRLFLLLGEIFSIKYMKSETHG